MIEKKERVKISWSIVFFAVILTFYISLFVLPVAKATSYVPGESLFPNCNPPNVNCGFSIAPNSVIAYIGDSWTAGNHIVHPLYYHINANFPFSGVGYVPVDAYPYNLPLNYYPGNVPPFENYPDTVPSAYEVTKISTGDWSDTVKFGSGLNLMHTNSSDITTPATKGVTCTGTDFTIYYLKQSGGGSFDYSVDSINIATVSTANASNALGTINITGQSLAEHPIVITVSVAGTTGVTLFGVDCKIANSGGIRVEKLGMSGSRGPNWAGVNANLWQSEIAELNPNLAIITLGINDIATESINTYISSIETIVTNIKTASPATDILLAPPTIYSTEGPAGNVSAYFPSLQDLARQDGHGYVEVSKFFGSYAEASANGLWSDSNPGHMSSVGDQLFANVLIDYLGLTDAPTITSITGQDIQDIAGGQSITINGTNFIDTSTVTVGGISATDVVFVSSMELTATAPANTTGIYDAVVTNYIQTTTCAGCMTYVDDSTGPLISNISLSPDSNSATITWTTDENSSSRVDYGLTDAYGNSTIETDTGAGVVNHTVLLPELSQCTTYHFRVYSKDIILNETIGTDNYFTTAGCGGSSGSRSKRSTTPIITPNPSPSSESLVYNFGPTVLKLKSRGEMVKELQRFLNAKLNLGLIVDGIFGPKTLAIVKQWQKDNGLVVDGLVGPKTKAKMNAN